MVFAIVEIISRTSISHSGGGAWEKVLGRAGTRFWEVGGGAASSPVEGETALEHSRRGGMVMQVCC